MLTEQKKLSGGVGWEYYKQEIAYLGLTSNFRGLQVIELIWAQHYA